MCVVLICANAVLAREKVDILTRTTALAERAEVDIVTGIVSSFLSRQWAAKPGCMMEQVFPLEDGELVHIVDADGRVVLSSDPVLRTVDHGYRFPGNDQVERKALWRRALSEEKGVGSYHSLSAMCSDVVRRELGWVHVKWEGRIFVFLIERESPVTTRFLDQPLTGKWMGAYSMKGNGVFSEGVDVESWRDAGQVSALILQNRAQCTVRMVAKRWEMEGAGLVISNSVTAGEIRHVLLGDDELWLFTGDYDSELDEIRGTVRVSGPRLYSERSIFLGRFTQIP